MFITTNNKSKTFETELKNSFHSFDNCIVSVGFLSKEKLNDFHPEIFKIAKKGSFTLIYGWTKDATEDLIKYLKNLNDKIKKINSHSGVFLSTKTFHGKVYSFYNKSNASVFLGSSNFSGGGFSGNIECNYKLDNFKECQEIINFQKKIDTRIITDIKFSPKKISTPRLSSSGKIIFESVKTKNVLIDNILEISKTVEFFEYPILEKANSTKSNLNACVASPKSKLKPKPRDAFEMEFIIPTKEIIKSCAPEKNVPFEVIMDDQTVLNFICYGKKNGENMSTVGDQTILGRWLKSKLLAKKIIINEFDLIKPIHIKKLNMTTLRFYKIDENIYKLKIIS